MNIPCKKPVRHFTASAVIVWVMLFLIFSCKTPRQVQYLQGPIDTAALSKISIPEPIIQKGDLIGITVYSDNPEATAVYNQQMTTSIVPSAATSSAGLSAAVGQTSPSMPGYLVDANGDIRFQSLGLLHVEGISRTALEQLLKEKLTPYLKNPYCNIRFLNYKFTMLGEVTRQGVYSIPNEKISILEALGMAGDITLYGEKDSILVIREVNGKRSFGYLDVSQPEVMLSPYYYLRQNDVVIVKANPKKPSISEQTATRRLTAVATITSILVSVSLIFSRIWQ
jgi:polysaccharide export outer membrane protein